MQHAYILPEVFMSELPVCMHVDMHVMCMFSAPEIAGRMHATCMPFFFRVSNMDGRLLASETSAGLAENVSANSFQVRARF